MKELETTPATIGNKEIIDPVHESKKDSPFFKPAIPSLLQSAKMNSPENTGMESIFKTKLSAGGFTGFKLDATFTVTDIPATTLQIVQVFWGTPHNALGKDTKIGKFTFTENKKDYDAFVDGGINSPYVTLSKMEPVDKNNPYYLTADEHKSQVTFTKDSGTIRTKDEPTSPAFFDEAFFETGVVAVNYNGKGSDKVLKVFQWGWKKKGADPIHGKGEKIDGKDSGITLTDSFSSNARKIISNDYPNYKYS